MLKPSETVQWLDGDAHRVGRVLRDEQGWFVKGRVPSGAILVQWSHTGELEFIDMVKLKPYPASPIPDPSPRPLALLDSAGQYGGPG